MQGIHNAALFGASQRSARDKLEMMGGIKRGPSGILASGPLEGVVARIDCLENCWRRHEMRELVLFCSRVALRNLPIKL